METTKTSDSAQVLSLPFTFGTELLIELVNLKLRIKSSVVGMEKGQYLIVKISQQDLIGNFRSEMVKESPMIIRFLYNNTIYGFNTQILNVVSSPEKLFIVDYPKKIDEAAPMQKSRYECVLPASTMFGNDIIDMIIVDISKEGCQCRIKASPRVEFLYKLIQVNMKVDIKVQFPGNESKFSLPGRVRNISKDPERIMLGVLFEEMPEATKQQLNNYIALIAEAGKAKQGKDMN